MLYENIRKYSKERKISISKIERELGFARGSICKWNKYEPSYTKVMKVADMLHVKIEKLIREDKGE